MVNLLPRNLQPRSDHLPPLLASQRVEVHNPIFLAYGLSHLNTWLKQNRIDVAPGPCKQIKDWPCLDAHTSSKALGILDDHRTSDIKRETIALSPVLVNPEAYKVRVTVAVRS